jgi:hypothetical protein
VVGGFVYVLVSISTILVVVDISFIATVATNIIIILEGYFRGEEKGLALTSIYDVGFGSYIAKRRVYLVAAV